MKNYITLFSNGDDNFIENSATHFKVKLPSKILLDESWQVGLCEIHYDKKWFNIFDDTQIKLRYFNMKEVEVQESVCIFPKGFYELNKFCSGLTTILGGCSSSLKFEKGPKFEHNKVLDKIQFHAGLDKNKKYVFPIFNDEFYLILGIDKEQYETQVDVFLENYKKERTFFLTLNLGDDEFVDKIENKIFIAKNTYNLSAGYHSLFVYTDIIKPNYVGDSFVKLLKVVEIPSQTEFGKKISIKYDNIQFFDLDFHEIDAIEVKISDDLGEPIKFVGDALTIVKLCFRKVNKNAN